MAKRPTGFGSWSTPAKQPKNPFAAPKPTDRPAPRKRHFEDLICDAVRDRCLIEMRYDDDHSYRLFAPYAVYNSTRDKVNVSGTQIENPEQPLDRYEPRIFEIGKMVDVRATKTKFQPDARFDRFDPRYKDGIICSV